MIIDQPLNNASEKLSLWDRFFNRHKRIVIEEDQKG